MKKPLWFPNIERLGCSKLFSLGLFLLFGTILVWRAPILLKAPLFCYEEGTVYFKFAYEHSLLRSLFFVYWKVGYFYLIVNVATAISAHIMPLEYAPFATFYVALFIQLIPFLIVLYGKSTVFTSIGKKIAACLIFLFMPNLTFYVWLNTLNSQVWFGLIAVMILLEDLERISYAKRWAYRSLLAVGTLSGVYVVFLQPIFALRSFTDRRKERYVHLGIVTVASLLQIGLVAVSGSRGLLSSRGLLLHSEHIRHGSSIPEILGNISLHHIGVPLFGYTTANRFAEALSPIGHYLFLILLLLALPIMLFYKTKGIIKLKDSSAILVVTLFILMAVTTVTAYYDWTSGAPRVIRSERYTIMSGFALLLIILDNIRLSQRPYISGVFMLFLLASLSVGVWKYRQDHKFPLYRVDGRLWKTAVATARQDPTNVIRFPPFVIQKLRVKPKDADQKTAPQPKVADTVKVPVGDQ